MKVSIVTDTFDYGGGLEHILQIVKGLPSLGFQIHAHPGNSLDRFSGLTNTEVFTHGYRPALIRKQKPDLIHIHHLRPLLAFFGTPWRRSETPVIYTAHGLHLHKYEFSRQNLDRVKFILRLALEKRLFARADKIIAVSRDDQQFIQTRYGHQHVIHIPNGIDPIGLAGGAPEPGEIDRQLGLPANRFLFVTAARFDFQKGYDVLMRAIAHIKDFLQTNRVRFLLVGDGPVLPEIEHLAARLAITELVVFMGRSRDAYRLIKSADILLHPSRWEGLPIVLLEAGLLKTPVLASTACGNRELLEENHGLLFENGNEIDLADKICAVVRNRYPLGQYAENLFRKVTSKYNVKGMLAGLMDVYQSTLAENRDNP